MKLNKFIDQFVRPNTLLRLWVSIEGGHEQVGSPIMEWEARDDDFLHSSSKVVGVTDIAVYDHYSEAVNIVIEF